MKKIPSHRVYKRTNWDHEWNGPVDYLYADQVVFATAPSIPTATLSYNAAPRVLRPDKEVFDSYDELDLQDKYIKIEIDQDTSEDSSTDSGSGITQPLVWYGIVTETVNNLYGANGSDTARNVQTFRCMGLEYLFTKKILDTSTVMKPDETEVTIHRAIGFNLGAGDERTADKIPNASGNLFGDGDISTVTNVPIFVSSLQLADALAINSTDIDTSADGSGSGSGSGSDPVKAYFWTAYDIINYLFSYQLPADVTGAFKIQCDVNAVGATRNILSYEPAIRVDGRSLYEVMTLLMDRQRGLTWWLKVRDDNVVQLQVQSFAESDIPLPGGDTFYANDNQDNWSFKSDLQVQSPIALKVDTAHVYDKVVCRGERIGTCFTIKGSDFDGGWNKSDEEKYLRGASKHKSYKAADATFQTQQSANEAVRADFTLRKVYSYFTLADDWDGKVDSKIIFPDPTDNTKSLPFWIPGLRFHHKLPLREGYDYSKNKIKDDGPDPEFPDNGHPEYLDAFGFIKDDRYKYIDRLNAPSKFPLYQREWSIDLRTQDEGLGIILHASGMPQFFLGAGDVKLGYNPTNKDGAPVSNDIGPDGEGTYTLIDADCQTWGRQFYTQKIDYHDLQFTLFLIGDAYAEGQWPATDPATSGDQFEVKVINIPNARKDRVLPDTVVLLDPEGQLVKSNGGLVRDDTQMLQDVAKVAFQWFNTPRKAYDVTLKNIVPQVQLGQLITNSNGRTLNSVVTQIVIDLKRNSHTIKTQFAELDGTFFSPEPRKLLGKHR